MKSSWVMVYYYTWVGMVEKCIKARKYASQSKVTNPGKDTQATGTVIAKTIVSKPPTAGITRLNENLKLGLFGFFCSYLNLWNNSRKQSKIGRKFPFFQEFTKILLLSETHWRPIRDPSETNTPDRRLITDLDMLHLRPTCLSRDLNMLHRRPTCLIEDP